MPETQSFLTRGNGISWNPAQGDTSTEIRPGTFLTSYDNALVTFSIAGGVISTLWQARQTQERFDQVRNLANRFLFD
jgi:hypothetical protein